jgi:hypothetical protein
MHIPEESIVDDKFEDEMWIEEELKFSEELVMSKEEDIAISFGAKSVFVRLTSFFSQEISNAHIKKTNCFILLN